MSTSYPVVSHVSGDSVNFWPDLVGNLFLDICEAAGPCQLPEPCYVCINLLPVLLSALSETVHVKCGVHSWSEIVS